jgi:hypothetical protein
LCYLRDSSEYIHGTVATPPPDLCGTWKVPAWSPDNVSDGRETNMVSGFRDSFRPFRKGQCISFRCLQIESTSYYTDLHAARLPFLAKPWYKSATFCRCSVIFSLFSYAQEGSAHSFFYSMYFENNFPAISNLPLLVIFP